METNLLGRLFKSIFKFVFSSLILGVISLVASTSFMSGKFPPDWKQIKNMFGTINKFKDFQRMAVKGASGGLDTALIVHGLKNQQQIVQLSAPGAVQGATQGVAQGSGQVAQSGQTGQAGLANNRQVAGAINKANNNSVYDTDPELADIRELVQAQKNMQNLSASLNGQQIPNPTIANNQPINNNPAANQIRNNRNPQQAGPPSAPGTVPARLQALEAQVENLTMRLRSLTGTIMELNEKLDRMPKAKR